MESLDPGTVIDGKFEIRRVHSTSGGMGVLLAVHDLSDPDVELALKLCTRDDADGRERFRREVRLHQQFSGNSKVTQIVHSNLEHDPPYYVMPFYPDGDLTTLATSLAQSAEEQERVFLEMADCISELHRRDVFHRDIKPPNFLRTPDGLAVSDLGLGVELGSETRFTKTLEGWGTEGYTPPEFREPGGFKNATAQSDIFMLGKSYYSLLTNKDPQFINDADLEPPLAFVINKCCAQQPTNRFESLAALKQALVSAYDILLDRRDPHGEAQIKVRVVERLNTEGKFVREEVEEFVRLICSSDTAKRWELVEELPVSFFSVLALPEFNTELEQFLPAYREAVEMHARGFSFAQVVASRMQAIFSSCENPSLRVAALEAAISMAIMKNRFAAMDTCIAMITSVEEGDPAAAGVQQVIQQNPEHFILSIEPVNCRNSHIAGTIKGMNES